MNPSGRPALCDRGKPKNRRPSPEAPSPCKARIICLRQGFPGGSYGLHSLEMSKFVVICHLLSGFVVFCHGFSACTGVTCAPGPRTTSHQVCTVTPAEGGEFLLHFQRTTADSATWITRMTRLRTCAVDRHHVGAGQPCALECGDLSPLSSGATCRAVPRSHQPSTLNHQPAASGSRTLARNSFTPAAAPESNVYGHALSSSHCRWRCTDVHQLFI